MEIKLISEDLFKENSPVTADTGIEDFVPYIGIAQRMYINKVLGKPLVTELENQIKAAQENPNANPYPISDKNKALLLMIAPPLSFYAVYQGLPFQWAKIVNKGLTVKATQENSKGVSAKDLAQLRRWLKDDAEFLLGELITYLCECAKNYPLWKPGDYCGGCGCDGDKKTNTPFDAGIFIPKRR